MVVVVDYLAFEETGEEDVHLYLLSLVARSPVQRYWYADEGPPPHLRRVRRPNWDGDLVDDWIVATGPDENGEFGAHFVDDEQVSAVLVPWDRSVDALISDTTPPTSYLSAPNPIKRMKADYLAVRVAESVGADVFITDRPFLFEAPYTISHATAVARPDEAVALLGLYLRHQGEFIVSRTPNGAGTLACDRGLFYWVAARELLPTSWRWMTACIQHSSAIDGDLLTYLSSSLIERIKRALLARDRLQLALCQPQDNNTGDDAMSELDQVCLLLMGATDVAAHVAHIVLRPKRKAYRNSDIGWQKRDWMRDVAEVRSSLAQIVSPNSTGADLLAILRALRNTIHGEALHSIAVHGPRSDRREETLVGLPRHDRQHLLAAIDRRGGRDTWGITELAPGYLYAHPGVLVETLLIGMVELLNSLLTETPVEHLAGVDLTVDDLRPPGEFPFDTRTRRHIRWQLGL